MTTKPLFRVLTPHSSAAADPGITIWFNDKALSVPSNRSVAAALLAAGVQRFRSTPVSGAPRAPYCMMGVCFECLVEIDGIPSRQSCMVNVHDGMRIRSQEGASDLPPGFADDASVSPHADTNVSAEQSIHSTSSDTRPS